MGGAAGDDDAAGREGVAEVVEDQPGAEADRFDDGAEHVGRRVLQGQPGQRAARLGVGVGGAVALEVIERQQAFAARRQLAGLLVERLEARLRREMTLEPGDDRAGRGLAALDDGLARIDGVHVGAPHARLVHGLAGNTEMKMRGAGNERHLVRFGDAEADHADEGVRSPLHDGNAGLQSEMVGRCDGQAADDGAGRQHFARPFLLQRLEARAPSAERTGRPP